MKRDSRAPLIVAIMLLVLPVLYVGSYFALVLPEPVVRDPFDPFFDHYRLGGRVSKVMFWPLEKLDRELRPGTWKESPSGWTVYPRT
jgi:hypothetical protein